MNQISRRDRDLAKPDGAEPERFDENKLINVGQWYWVEWDNRREKSLMCVTAIGSNYIGFDGRHSSGRVHIDNFSKQCTREDNFKAIIQQNVTKNKQNAERLLREINELTQKLGVAPTLAVEHESDTRSLSVLNGQVDVKAYKKSLIVAKNTTLPKLFKEVEEANEAMADWIKVEMIPMKASLGQMKEVIATIEDRVFHVELYAGLSESVAQVREGKSAPVDAKLHLMQRRCYMDEECLADYRAGGMDIRSLDKFDAWLSEPDHLNNILPFPRCMAAFRVRRNSKKRDWSSIASLLANIAEDEADKFTYLYVRNGEQLYRMRTSLEFGEKIFPDTREIGGEPMMFHMSGSSVENLITKREYEAKVRAKKEKAVQHAAWCKENKKKPKKPDDVQRGIRWETADNRYQQDEASSPYREGISWYDRLDDYEPYDHTSVHYDDVTEHIAAQIKQYNRIALIIQGLFDRSPVLHPHPPVSLWTEAGFQAAVTLILDSYHTLNAGPTPDFESYRARVNDLLDGNSVTIGQEDAWQRAEAVKENARAARDWRSRDYREKEHFSPYGNPGPGYITKVTKCGRTTCTFTWQRERSYRNRRYYGDPDGPINCHIQVPHDKLFNVSAYKPGDFRQFYADPRTRAQYLKWAPFLIAAEEWHHEQKTIKDGSAKAKGKK